MSLLDDIKAKLTTDSVVDGSTWKAFIGYAPDTQDQVIILTPTGGFPQETHGGENTQETFQLRVRAAEFEYDICEAKWREAFDSLQDADLSANSIYHIQAQSSGPGFIMDDNNRPNMTVTFLVIRAKP